MRKQRLRAETVAEDAPYENLPILSKKDLPPEWQGDYPVLCVAAQSPRRSRRDHARSALDCARFSSPR